DFWGSVSGKITPGVGIVYKAQVKQQVSFRANASYFSEKKHDQSGPGVNDAAWDHRDKERRVALAMGLEQQMSLGRFSSYLFGDIYQQYVKRRRYGYSSSHGNLSIYDYSDQYYQLGLAAGVGIKIKLIKRLSLNVEAHTRAVRAFKSKLRYGSYEAYFNPISRLSINYRL
ncbi:MAG: hypothetical protein ACI9JN_002028, partial [Bacteroidia bacterium]